jgi:glycosyltransferase involved in cell wall biosynthesis
MRNWPLDGPAAIPNVTPSVRPRVLVITADRLGAELTGPAIRAYELARVLSEDADVTLAGLAGAPAPPDDLATALYDLRDPSAIRGHVTDADCVVAPPPWPILAGWMRASGARLVIDIYNPEPLEVLQFLAGRPPLLRRAVYELTLDRLLNGFLSAHHLMCAGEKQRDMWTGWLLSQRLIDPSVYDADPSLRDVLDTVPFGLPDEPPERHGPGLRAAFGLDAGDEVILWNGGIWNWLDAPGAVSAMALLRDRRPRAKLVFMGGSSAASARRATDEARALARDHGLLDTSVFFNEGWVSYDERGAWLLDADCAVSTHLDHLESRYAFRTRLLDCFWAGLPIVCTRGDELADRVERERLGETVPVSDPAALAGALDRVLSNGRAAYADALRRAADELAWTRATEPLVRWITSGALPPRVGAPASRRAGHALRDTGFRAALRPLHRVGIRPWPSL